VLGTAVQLLAAHGEDDEQPAPRVGLERRLALEPCERVQQQIEQFSAARRLVRAHFRPEYLLELIDHEQEVRPTGAQALRRGTVELVKLHVDEGEQRITEMFRARFPARGAHFPDRVGVASERRLQARAGIGVAARRLRGEFIRQQAGESTDQLLLRGVGIRNTKARLEQLYGPTAALLLRSLGSRGVVALIFIPLQHAPQPQRPVAVGAAS